MQKKKIHIELLRIFAIYCVMFNHTQNGGFFYFAENTAGVLYGISMFLSVLCKVAVPLFFMITGALLLGKEESLKTLFLKRFLKFFLLLIAVSALYYVCLSEDCSVSGFLKAVYSSETTTGLWYLYSYLGLLLMMPILRKLVRMLTEKEYRYILACQILLAGIIPMVEYLLWQGRNTLNSNFSAVIFTTSNIFYALMGYYCENVLDITTVSRKKIFLHRS